MALLKRAFLVLAVRTFIIAGTAVWNGHTARGSELVITNLAQLGHLTNEQGMFCSVSLTGTVLWVSEAQGRVIVQDAFGTDSLESKLPAGSARQGSRLMLNGRALLLKRKETFQFLEVPLVDNDGRHSATEKSARVDLRAGRNPIRLECFNWIKDFELAVEYEGPGLPRQKIPDKALFREVVSANGAANFVNGLDYRCVEGEFWSVADLRNLPAVKSGTVNNFDITVKTRPDLVGLQFSGYLAVPQDGAYTFYTRSDDGSYLFVGEPSLKITVAGENPLPPAHRLAIGQLLPEGEDYQWAEIEGTVVSVNNLPGALEMELISETGRMHLTIAEPSNLSFTVAPNNRVRAKGVCHSILTAEGHRVAGEFLVQNWKNLEQIYVAPALWTAYPLTTISNLLAKPFPTNSVVHLRGRVRSPGSGTASTLDDGNGQIPVYGLSLPDSGNLILEILGRCRADGMNIVVQAGVHRQAAEGGQSSDLPTLTAAEQVNFLSRDELKRGYPVKLQGVVTCLNPGVAIIQGSTRGIPVNFSDARLQVGDFCEIEGATAPGEFSPYVQSSRIINMGPGRFPDPVHPTWDQLVNGSLDCQYVEIEGVVTAVTSNRVTLLTRGGRITVQLKNPGNLPLDMEQALIRLRGVLFAEWNTDVETRGVKVGQITLDSHWVNVVQPAPTDPFAIPVKRVGELLRYDPQAGALKRVKVSGQIIYEGKAGCFLMDEGNGLRFDPTGPFRGHVCDLVEVVGFPELSGPSPLVGEAMVRRSGLAELPPARKLEAEKLLSDDYDSTLVTIEGILVGISSKPEWNVLEMQNGLRRFTAVLEDKNPVGKTLLAGSRLELTGVYVGQGGNRVLGRPIDSFQVLLNSPFDIRVLSRPPWWNFKRLLTAVALLGGVLMLTLVWIKLLQKKVAERTLQLETQITERQRTERQRIVEQERARVAQDLHDDLGAGLTEVNMLTTLARSPNTSGDEKSHYLDELNETARRMVTSLDEIVWAVNPRNDTVASLASYFGSYSQRLLDLAAISCGLDVAEDLPDYPLDPKFRQELFLAFKEALTNVVRHSEAKKVWLRISVREGALLVAVADDGHGVSSAERKAGDDGLANMHERLRALGGSCEVQSDPKNGTTVRFEAPLPRALL
jgi:signal transduction histidine kinase